MSASRAGNGAGSSAGHRRAVRGRRARVRHRVDLRDPGCPDPAVAGRPRAPAGPGAAVATFAGATSVLLSLIGFLRWVFVVPPLAAPTWPATRPPGHPGRGERCLDANTTSPARSWEHLAPLLVIGWSITLSGVIPRTGPCLAEL